MLNGEIYSGEEENKGMGQETKHTRVQGNLGDETPTLMRADGVGCIGGRRVTWKIFQA